MNRRVNESVLDDIDRSVVKREDIISDRPDALNYDTLFLFGVEPTTSDSEFRKAKIQALGYAIGADVHVEEYTKEKFKEVFYVQHSQDIMIKTKSVVCVFANLHITDYQKAKFFLLLCRTMFILYKIIGTYVLRYRNKNGDMFKYVNMKFNVIDNVNGLFSQNILNAKNNQTMNIMSFSPAVSTY